MNLYLLAPEVAGDMENKQFMELKRKLEKKGFQEKFNFYIMSSMDGLGMIC